MSKTVLLVDDEADIREVARVSLETVAGWEVHTASEGEQALEVAEAQRPDAILLDVMMPDMDGPTVFGRLQEAESTRGIPVILLTAKTQPGDFACFDELGVAGVLTKPFDPMALAHEVAGVLGWPR